MMDNRKRGHRRRFVPRAIRLRLTLWYVALLAMVLLGFSAFLHASLARNLYGGLDHRLRTEKLQVIDALDLDEQHPELDDFDELPTGLIVALYDHTHARFIVGNSHQPLPVPAEALSRARQQQDTASTVRLTEGAPWRVLTVPVSQASNPVGLLQMARSESDIDATLDHLVSLMLLAIPLTLVLASSGGLFLASRALNPIDRITGTAEQIEAQDLSQRLNLPESPDEVGRLAATFDRMLDRLERAFQQQRQFTADASHELRTPLALLISRADVALERNRCVEEYRHVIAGMREDAARMSHLLDTLLTLARSDMIGQHDLIMEPLPLDDLIHGVVETMVPLATMLGVRLEAQLTMSIMIEGDQTRLTQLLVNLIDNGLKYTAAGGTVTISAERAGCWAELRVADTGQGIAAEHLPQVFERFYRADTARARSAGGAGLGLAICHWIAQAHGGSITVASQVGHGTAFTVRLPLHDES